MLDSFIIGALTSLIVSLAVYGWKFFHIKNPSDKQLLMRIIIGSIIVVINLFIFIGSFAGMVSIKDDVYITGMLIGLFILLIPFIIVVRILYKDVIEYLLRRKTIKKDKQTKGVYSYENDSNTNNNSSKQKDTKITEFNKESLALNIILLKRLQIIVVSIMSVFVAFLVLYPVCSNYIFKNKLPDKTEYLTIKLTNLDANKKVYHIMEENYNYIYVNKNDKIVLYKFHNSSMYSSSKIEKTGYATSLEIKNYFEDELVSGYPTISSIMPGVIPLGIIIGLLFVISIIILLFYIRRIAQEIIFKLGNSHKVFKKLKEDFKNEVISKYDYDKLNKHYFSQLIMENNTFMCLFKIFY